MPSQTTDALKAKLRKLPAPNSRSHEILGKILRQLEVMRNIPSTGLRLRERAVDAGVDFILSDRRFDHMQVTRSNLETLRGALAEVTVDGMVAEFGVYKGETLTVIARHFGDHTVHGFDSFVGLPESWGGTAKGKGAFSIGGQPPELPVRNVEFHVGFFDETVPKFAAAFSGPFSFVHMDADLYSSTRTVFTELADWFVDGTVIVFDEYFGYHGWQHHEHKAFLELLDDKGFSFEALSLGHMNLAVRLTR